MEIALTFELYSDHELPGVVPAAALDVVELLAGTPLHPLLHLDDLHGHGWSQDQFMRRRGTLSLSREVLNKLSYIVVKLRLHWHCQVMIFCSGLVIVLLIL